MLNSPKDLTQVEHCWKLEHGWTSAIQALQVSKISKWSWSFNKYHSISIQKWFMSNHSSDFKSNEESEHVTIPLQFHNNQVWTLPIRLGLQSTLATSVLQSYLEELSESQTIPATKYKNCDDSESTLPNFWNVQTISSNKLGTMTTSAQEFRSNT